MPKCGDTYPLKDEESARVAINDALSKGSALRPVVITKEGVRYKILRPSGDKGADEGRYVVVKYKGEGKGWDTKSRVLSTRSMAGGAIDTESSALREYQRAMAPTWQKAIDDTTEKMHDLFKDVDGYNSQVVQRILDSAGTERRELGKPDISRPWHFLSRYFGARNALSRMYDHDGLNLQAEWGARIDARLQQVVRDKRAIMRVYYEEVLGHMSNKEKEAGKDIMMHLLDGSSDQEVRDEFGRAPTEKEILGAFKTKVFFGPKRGEGLHGLFGMEGFIDDYVPHMKRYRNLHADIMEKLAKGEVPTEEELAQLAKLQNYGISEGVPHMKNAHELEREWGMNEIETDLHFIVERYVEAGLRNKYLEPIVKDIEARYGGSFFHATGEWKDDQFVDGVMVSKRKNIGRWEKEYLTEHFRTALNYPTEMERALNMKVTKGAKELQQMVKGIPIINKMPIGDATFTNSMSTLTKGMYYGALGGSIPAALKQITGLPLVFAELGPKWSAVGLAKLAANPREAYRRADAAGLFREYLPSKEMAADKALRRTLWKKLDFGVMYMFEVADQSQRVIAYEGGKARALALKDKLSVKHIRDVAVRNRLEKYKADKNWEAFANEYGINASHESQFKYGKADSPVAFRSSLGRAMGMFLTWQMYFTGKLGHWVYGGRGDGKLKAMKYTMEHVGPFILATWLLMKLADEAGVDVGPWFTNMFEVPDMPGPPARLAYDTLRVANAGAKKFVSEFTNENEASRKWRKRELGSAWHDMKSELWLTVPLSRTTKDTYKAVKAFQDEGLGAAIKAGAGLKPKDEGK